MGAAQIVMLFLIAAGLGIDAERHGKPRDGYHSFWVTLTGTIITCLLLWWGGFWG